ncbi:MAG: sulfoxide reductase heme-binding subunit YedZ [candidate division KSB1 bacterium]|nr:sulfoxide reductase heme-binding subunit YedZ [candidate division KSB1 bacterium]
MSCTKGAASELAAPSQASRRAVLEDTARIVRSESAGRITGRHTRALFRLRHPRWLPAVVVASGFLPLVLLGAGFASDVLRDTRFLSANPIEFMEHFTGEWNLRFLALTLAVTPAIKLTGLGWLIRYRRIFGLFAFLYIAVHLAIYFCLDVELSWSDLIADVTERTYITLGMLGFSLLIPLALTSTKAWIRRLGSKRWTAIHRLVYPAALLGVAHYWMAVKKDITEPLMFASIFALLLGYRLVALRRGGPWGARHASAVVLD